MPALIYFVYAMSHVLIDLYKGLHNRAMIDFLIGCMFTLTLHVLCENGMSAISWVIVAIPFLLMTVIATILLVIFGLNPTTGKAVSTTESTSDTPDHTYPEYDTSHYTHETSDQTSDMNSVPISVNLGYKTLFQSEPESTNHLNVAVKSI